MNREEILEKSRAENKNRDIYEQEVLRQAGNIAGIVMMSLTAIFFAVQIFVGGGMNWGMWAIVFSGCMASFWVKYIRLRRRHELVIAILYTIITVSLSVGYIYDLIASSAIL